jgi:gamma-glutamylputrescine oxidase
VKTTPLWQPAALPAARPAPTGSVRADVAIVGGGLTGLSAAYHLAAARPGIRVVLLEAGALGAGASGRNTGMLGPGVGQSLAALAGRLGPARAAALYRETLRAVFAAQALIERERIACDLQMTGQLLRARSAQDRRRLARQASMMAALDLPVEALDDDELAAAVRLAPAGGRRQDGPAALRLPHAGLVDPGKLVAGLAARATERGAALYTGARVLGIADGRAGQPARLGLAGGGEVVADRVVMATAGYTAALGLLRGRVLPVHLQALATAPLPRETLATLGWSRREGVVEARRIFNYFRLTADRRLVFGGAAPRYHWAGRAPAGDARAACATLSRALGAAFPADSGLDRVPITHVWTGVIGFTLDALPALGRDRDQPAIVHALGWCGHGLALALASGAWVNELLFDDDPRALGRAGGLDLARLAWFRAAPPALPGEALRWLSFRAAVGMMGWLDRVA